MYLFLYYFYFLMTNLIKYKSVCFYCIFFQLKNVIKRNQVTRVWIVSCVKYLFLSTVKYFCSMGILFFIWISVKFKELNCYVIYFIFIMRHWILISSYVLIIVVNALMVAVSLITIFLFWFIFENILVLSNFIIAYQTLLQYAIDVKITLILHHQHFRLLASNFFVVLHVNLIKNYFLLYISWFIFL